MSIIRFEFQKLDEVDLKVAFWLSDHHPEALQKYFKFIQTGYARRGVVLNVPRLLEEFEMRKIV